MDFVAATNYKDTPEVSVFQDVGCRDDQQDRYVVSRLDTGLLIAVADGHGGHTASSLVAKHLSLIFSEEVEHAIHNDKRAHLAGLSSSKVRRIIRKTFQKLIKLTKDTASGSTLTLAFIETGSVHPHFAPAVRVTVGQLGDSVFAISPEPGRLSVAPMHSVRHRRKDVQEIKKLFNAKYGEECKTSAGYIYSSPVKYIALALTRALGDCAFTLIRKPDVKTYVVDPEQAVMLLATDGILKDETNSRTTIKKIIGQIRQGEHVAEINRKLRPLEDNTTIVAVRNFR